MHGLWNRQEVLIPGKDVHLQDSVISCIPCTCAARSSGPINSFTAIISTRQRPAMRCVVCQSFGSTRGLIAARLPVVERKLPVDSRPSLTKLTLPCQIFLARKFMSMEIAQLTKSICGNDHLLGPSSRWHCCSHRSARGR